MKSVGVNLDGKRLRNLIDDRGGVSKFLEDWTTTSGDGNEDLDRATVYRWFGGQLPKSETTLLRLSSLLDVDPFALLGVTDRDLGSVADDLVDIVQRSRSIPAPLQLLRDFFGRQQEWPPERMARVYFGRSWFMRDFDHDPSEARNIDATIALTTKSSARQRHPYVFHFAFRHPRLFAERWLEYGIVLKYCGTVTLWHINGYSKTIELATPDEPARVQTWFGQGPAIFRVASLHPFNLELAFDDAELELRFPA